MLIYTIFVLLLSPSQGSFRSTGHHVNLEDRFEDALLEHLYEIHEADSDYDLERQKTDVDLLDVLDTIRKEAEHEQKQRTARIRDYENYGHKQSHKKSLKTAIYELIHPRYFKKDIIKDFINHKYKKSVGKSDGNNLKHFPLKKKDEVINKKETVAVAKDHSDIHKHSSINEKKEIANSQDFAGLVKDNDVAVTVMDEDSINKNKDVKSVKKEDNNQVATVKIDDSVERQQEVINNINPRDIFLEADANSSTNSTRNPSVGHRVAPFSKVTTNKDDKEGLDKVSFIAVVAGCVVAGIAGIALATYCWYKLRNETKELNDEPSLKTKKSPNSIKKEPTEDEKLAQSAEVFHYLHAKKQMQQMEEPIGRSDVNGHETTDDEDDEDTVYECPGLAPPGDMKVVNPLFSDAESHHSDKHSDSHSLGDENEKKKSISSISSVGEQKP